MSTSVNAVVGGVEPSKCLVRVRITLATIGIIVGVSTLPCFGVKYKNWDAGVWGFVSGIFAACTLYVHIQYVSEVWKTWVYRLRYPMLVGCFVMLAGFTSFVTYLTLAITEDQEFSVYGRNYYIVVVWNLMTFKWGFALFYYSRSYRNLYSDEYKLPYQKL